MDITDQSFKPDETKTHSEKAPGQKVSNSELSDSPARRAFREMLAQFDATDARIVEMQAATEKMQASSRKELIDLANLVASL